MPTFSKTARRAARQRALQALFQWEFQPASSPDGSRALGQPPLSAEEQDYAERLVRGVLDRRQELDAIIGRYAHEWSIDRMPVVDRNILRCALFELLWIPDVPAKVTINEAIELAKRFADEDARRFINGVLDRILQEEPDLAAKRGDLAHDSC